MSQQSNPKQLTPEEVAHVARLARLELSPQELEQYRQELSSIVGYMERLSQVDTSQVPATLGVHPHANVFREDVAGEPMGPAKVLANAPQPEGGAFQIPRILEEN